MYYILLHMNIIDKYLTYIYIKLCTCELLVRLSRLLLQGAFAALLSDGSVYTWGAFFSGGHVGKRSELYKAQSE